MPFLSLLLGLLDLGLSLLFNLKINAGDSLNNALGTINAYIFPAAIFFAIGSLIFFNPNDDGCAVISGYIVFFIVFIISYIIYIPIMFHFPNIIITFKTNIILYYSSSAILIVGGLIGIIKYIFYS